MTANKHWAVAFVAGMSVPADEARAAVRVHLHGGQYAEAAAVATERYHGAGPWLTRLVEAFTALGDEAVTRDLAADCTTKRLLAAWTADAGDRTVEKVYNKVVNGQQLLTPEEIGAATYAAPKATPAKRQRTHTEPNDEAPAKRARPNEDKVPKPTTTLFADDDEFRAAIERTLAYYDAAAKREGLT